MKPGTRLGPYEIVGTIGAGGMGEVYRARDSRLGRDVAIKVSAEHFSDRFEREARAIAALNHPHICTLHDVGPNYLVMELVEGPTLADRIDRGPIAVDETLRIARQMADALATAHDKGIVHRDLKPANVKLTPSGAVKVLDFGLAQQTDAGSLDRADDSPTRLAQTRAGVIVGTIAYMSPEQARGLAVDKRADVWAFGVILFEMLTGARPFEGATVSDTLAAVLTREPDWSRIPATMRPLVQRCLTADPSRRLRDLGDLDLLLERAPSSGPARRPWLAWAAAALLLATLGPVAFLHLRERPGTPRPLRFQIPPTIELGGPGNFSLSPDGRYLAFFGLGADGITRLWIRAMDSLEVRALSGSEAAAPAVPPPFWSPDSRFVAFDAGGKLKKLDVSGGLPQVLCDLPGVGVGGSWNRNGDIIVGNTDGGVLHVRENGGTVSVITALDRSRNEEFHLLPSFLPDGRHFVYLRIAPSTPEKSGTYVGTLDAKPEEQSAQPLMPYVVGLTYAAAHDLVPDRLLFVREGTLMAQAFDAKRLTLSGNAVPVADRVGSFRDGAFFSTSLNDTLVYRSADADFQIGVFDRRGTPSGRLSEPAAFRATALSPDGSRAVASRTDPQDGSKADLWLFDLSGGGGTTRLTFGGRLVEYPVWSPDGKHIAFTVNNSALHQKLASGEGEEKELARSISAGLIRATGWSQDGRFLLYAVAEVSNTLIDLWVLPTDGRKPVPFLQTRFIENHGRFSPDGHWVAYVSDQSGVMEVYVRAFAADFSAGSASTGGSVLASRGGGTSPRWRGDGRELFYQAPDGKIMTVEVTAGPQFRGGTPVPLFQTPSGAIVGDVSADGKRFLLATPVGPSHSPPFTVVLNWTAGMKP
jgi:serine/threonine protein kinase